jgi:hypothetical protein
MCILHIKMEVSEHTMTSHPSPDALRTDQEALLATLTQLLEPLARLSLAKGVSIQAFEERVRRAYVQAAADTCEGMNPDRLTSRISTMTGLTRREVARIQTSQAPARPVTRSLAIDVLTYWASQPGYIDARGQPVPIARSGAAPSFDALASFVTRDVHPKSVLVDMLRLGLVTHDSVTDQVALVESVFVPNGDWPRMMGFLGANVGDHLLAAVDNVLGDGHQHFEQSLLADELSADALNQAKALISGQWRALMTHLGPELQALMEQDRAAGRAQNQQLRIGLYSYMTAMPVPQSLPGDMPSTPDDEETHEQ